MLVLLAFASVALACAGLVRHWVRLSNDAAGGGQPAIVALADAIGRETGPPLEQVAAVQSVVECTVHYEVRALADATDFILGRPLTVERIVDERGWTGDCKSKAVMAIAILRTLGFSCRPVLNLARWHMFVEVQVHGQSFDIFDTELLGGNLGWGAEPIDAVQRVLISAIGTPYRGLPQGLDMWILFIPQRLKRDNFALYATQYRDAVLMSNGDMQLYCIITPAMEKLLNKLAADDLARTRTSKNESL